jgi:hypothetical protein
MILDLPVVLDYGPAYEDYDNRIIRILQQIADGRKKVKYLVLRPLFDMPNGCTCTNRSRC